MLIRKRLFERENAPPSTRVNPDTGEVEVSVDGETWTEAPTSDPRQNPAMQYPPNTETDVRCAAAAGMVTNVQNVINGAAGGTTVAGIATLLLTLLLIPGIGWMWAAILLFASAFVAATSAAVLAAFTEEVYEFLLCAFYDQLDAEGRITEEGLTAVQALAAAEFPDPLVGDILAGIFNMHHFVGFNNAGVAYADGEAECECIDCTYTDPFIDPELGALSFNNAPPSGNFTAVGDLEAGTAVWQATGGVGASPGSPYWQAATMNPNFPTLRGVSLVVEIPDGCDVVTASCWIKPLAGYNDRGIFGYTEAGTYVDGTSWSGVFIPTINGWGQMTWNEGAVSGIKYLIFLTVGGATGDLTGLTLVAVNE